MKLQLNNYQQHAIRKTMLLAALFMTFSPMFATGGEAAITDAADSIRDYIPSIKILLKVIGGLVGLIGGLRIYNKWVNGDQDINKEVVMWGGAALFLILVPTFIDAIFLS